jgi:hypothetical protein
LNRLVEFQAENNGLGIDDMISAAVKHGAPRLKGFQKLIQQQNEQLLLTYLLAASINDEASFATKAELLKAIDDLKTYNGTIKTQQTLHTKAFIAPLERMKFRKSKTDFLHRAPGSPIGFIVE